MGQLVDSPAVPESGADAGPRRAQASPATPASSPSGSVTPLAVAGVVVAAVVAVVVLSAAVVVATRRRG